MVKTYFSSLLLLTGLIISVFTSCLTAEPPQLIIETNPAPLLLDGTRDFPDLIANPMEDGVFYCISPETLTGFSKGFLEMGLPEEYAGDIFFYLTDGTTQTVHSKDLNNTGETGAILFTEFRMEDLKGIVLEPGEKELLPDFRVRYDSLINNFSENLKVPGLIIEKTAPDLWEIAIRQELWSEKLTGGPWEIILRYIQGGEQPYGEGQAMLPSLIVTPGSGPVEEYDFFSQTRPPGALLLQRKI